jgi:hypothetical protein
MAGPSPRARSPGCSRAATGVRTVGQAEQNAAVIATGPLPAAAMAEHDAQVAEMIETLQDHDPERYCDGPLSRNHGVFIIELDRHPGGCDMPVMRASGARLVRSRHASQRAI